MLQGRVIQNQTLVKAFKHIHHLSIQSDQPLHYQTGDWLLVSADNPKSLVELILNRLNLSGHESIDLGRRIGEMTSEQALFSSLEITQLNPAILNKLQRQALISGFEDRQSMIDYAGSKDVLDLLDDYPQLCALKAEFLCFLSPLAPRYYSIASANDQGDQVDLIFRRVEYQRNNRNRVGVVTSYLCDLKAGDHIEFDIKANPLFKADNCDSPIIMIAAGTGLAPFMGFMQQRKDRNLSNNQPDVLFFGDSFVEGYLPLLQPFSDQVEMHVLQSRGDLPNDLPCNISFTRGYVTQALQQQINLIWSLWKQGAKLYICGSQAKLATSLERVIQKMFVEKQGVSEAHAQKLWQDLRKQRRIQLDVY